jgi:hypothetical protein
MLHHEMWSRAASQYERFNEAVTELGDDFQLCTQLQDVSHAVSLAKSVPVSIIQ